MSLLSGKQIETRSPSMILIISTITLIKRIDFRNFPVICKVIKRQLNLTQSFSTKIVHHRHSILTNKL